MNEEKQQSTEQAQAIPAPPKKRPPRAIEYTRIGPLTWIMLFLSLLFFLFIGQLQKGLEQKKAMLVELKRRHQERKTNREKVETKLKESMGSGETWNSAGYQLPTDDEKHFLPHRLVAKGNQCRAFVLQEGEYYIELWENKYPGREDVLFEPAGRQPLTEWREEIEADWKEMNIKNFRNPPDNFDFGVKVKNLNRGTRIVIMNYACPQMVRHGLVFEGD